MARRAFIVVLDAVGAGELPDAAAFGDEGSSTLAHVADAVGGLQLPHLQALGLGNVMPLAGCPPEPSAPSVAGRLLERSLGKDTTVGHWELAGVVTERAFPTYPHGFPDDLLAAFSEATGRGRDRQRARLRHRDHRAAGRGAPAHGQVDRLHLRRLGLPDRCARDDRAARGAVRGLPHRARSAHGRARRRSRDRPPVRGRAGRVRAHGRTGTTSRSSRRGRTTSRASARPAGG